MIRPTIRLARDSEGEDIRHILDEVGQIPEGLDWSRVYPYWLVAEHDGIIVGCAQVLPGFPLGHFGFWGILPGYQNKGIGIFLWKAVEKLLANGGSDGFTGMTLNEQVLKHLPEVGGVVFGDPCHLIFKRVPRINRSETNGRRQDQIHDDD